MKKSDLIDMTITPVRDKNWQIRQLGYKIESLEAKLAKVDVVWIQITEDAKTWPPLERTIITAKAGGTCNATWIPSKVVLREYYIDMWWTPDAPIFHAPPKEALK
jgi:hypothetical protein